MDSWVWMIIGLAAGIVVASIVILNLRRDSTVELEQSDAEIKSQLAELETKSAVLQDKLDVTDATLLQEHARLEADYRQKLDSADIAYRNNLARLEKKFADLNASLYGQVADESEDDQADSEEKPDLNSPDNDSELDTIGRAGALAALAAIAENELLAESQTTGDGLFYSLEKAVADGEGRKADQEDGQPADKLDKTGRTPDSGASIPFEIGDPEQPKLATAAEAALDFEETAGEEGAREAAVETAETDDVTSSAGYNDRSSEAAEDPLATGSALIGAAQLSDKEDIDEADVEQAALSAPQAEDVVDGSVEDKDKISKPVEIQLDWLEGIENAPISLEDVSDEPQLTVLDEIEPALDLVAPDWPDDTSTWHGQFFNNKNMAGDPVLTREDAVIDFDWGFGSPAPEINTDGFSARWRRTANLPPGLYRFSVTSDDGVRLWVDGRMMISVWYDHTELTLKREVRLLGGPVELQLDYYDSGSVALVKVSWERIG